MGNMALHEPPLKPKNVGNSCKNSSFSMLHRVRKIGGVGPSLGPGCAVLGPTAAQAGANGSCSVEVGRKAIQMDPKLKP